MFPLVHQLAAVVFLRGEQHQEEVEEERVLLIPERRRKQPQGNKKSRTTTNAELGTIPFSGTFLYTSRPILPDV